MRVFTDFLKSCMHYIDFIFTTDQKTIPENYIKLYPGGFVEHTYPQFQNSQESALDGGDIFDTLANNNESNADEVFISAL